MSSSYNSIYTTQVQTDLKMQSVRVVKSFYDYAEFAPFLAMNLGRGRTINETNQEFKWVELRPNRLVFYVAPAAANVTSLTVQTTESSVGFVSANSIIMDKKTGEQMLVTAVTGKVLTVVRGYGAVAAAAITEDNTGSGRASLINLSRAFPEGSLAPEGTVMLKTTGRNYTQIFRDTLKITRNELKTRRYDYDDDGNGNVGDRRKDRRQKTFKDHQRNMEMQLLFGSPKEDLSGTDIRYVTGGLTHFITTNVHSIVNKTLFSTDTINDIMAEIADAGAAGDKVLMAGSKVMRAIDSNSVTTFGGGAGAEVREYGLGVRNIMTNFGNLKIVFNQVLSSVHPEMGIFLNMDNIRLHVIQDTKLFTNITVPGDLDAVVDTFLTELGLEVNNEESHAILTLDW